MILYKMCKTAWLWWVYVNTIPMTSGPCLPVYHSWIQRGCIKNPWLPKVT